MTGHALRVAALAIGFGSAVNAGAFAFPADRSSSPTLRMEVQLQGAAAPGATVAPGDDLWQQAKRTYLSGNHAAAAAAYQTCMARHFNAPAGAAYRCPAPVPPG